MAIRGYFAQAVPATGNTGRLYRHPVALDIVPALWDQKYSGADACPSAETGPGNEIYFTVDLTAAQHTLLVADPRVTYIPTETGTGALVLPSQPISSISAANRTLIRAMLAARHIPDDGLTGSDPVSAIDRRIRRCLELDADILKADALRQGLDTLVSALTTTQRQAIRAKLLARDLDFDTVLPTDTLREAKIKIVLQNRGAWRA